MLTSVFRFQKIAFRQDGSIATGILRSSDGGWVVNEFVQSELDFFLFSAEQLL